VAESVLSQQYLRGLPRTVREELTTLPPDAQKRFLDTFEKRRKRVLVAYPLALLYGLHYVYLEDTSTGIWFWFTVGGFGIWWVIDLFRLPGMVKHRNSVEAIKVLGEIRPVQDKPAF
jgi:hypothetical protein